MFSYPYLVSFLNLLQGDFENIPIILRALNYTGDFYKWSIHFSSKQEIPNYKDYSDFYKYKVVSLTLKTENIDENKTSPCLVINISSYY